MQRRSNCLVCNSYISTERAQVRSISLTHTPAHKPRKSAQICALFVKMCLLLELFYGTIIVSKTSRNWWNQGVFRPQLFGFAAVAASRHNASCDGSGPRGLGFESRHSDQKSGIRFCGFQIFYWCGGIRKDGTSAHTGVKKCPVDTFLVRGRIP